MPVVILPRELIGITLEIFLAHVAITPVQGSLEIAPQTLRILGVDVRTVYHVFLLVKYSIMLIPLVF